MLTIDPTKVCYVIIKAREFHVKVDPGEMDEGSNPSDEDVRSILEDYEDDPTYEELKSFLESLNEDEIVDLLALTWLGRGVFTTDDWANAIDEAQRANNEHTPDYLIGTPLLSDYLEEGLSQFGQSCQEFEMGRL